MSTSQNVLSEQSLRVSGPGMSRLLGISLIEYYNLNHGVLEEATDRFKNRVYQLKINEHNDPDLLRKLNVDESFTLYFSEQEINTVRSL